MIQTIRQQLKAMFLVYLFAGIVLLLLALLSTIPDLISDIIIPYLIITSLIWPILSASLLFNKEFQCGALPYLFGAAQSRQQILRKKILPSLILGLIPVMITMTIITVLSPGTSFFSTIPYFGLYFTFQAISTIFSFQPSIMTIFTLSVGSSILLWGLIPLFTYLVNFWKGGIGPLRNFFPVSLLSSSSAGDTLVTLGLLSAIPLLLLIAWLYGFLYYSEPDHQRTYRIMIPKGVLIASCTALIIFMMIYFFMPVEQWGENHLTREGHLFFHGYRESRLITETGHFTLSYREKSEFLAETDEELILTVPGNRDQFDLIGWSKLEGATRLICRLPATRSHGLIFHPPHNILYLASSNSGEWIEIDLVSGRQISHPFIPFNQKGGKKIWHPIAALSNGASHMLLTAYLQPFSFWRSDLNGPKPIYLCQSNEPPRFLGECVGLPVQLSENEIVMAIQSRGSMEKYRLVDDQFSLVESAPIPKVNHWGIVRDYRFWPSQQPLFTICGPYRERSLLTVHLTPLVTSLTPLDSEEIGLSNVSTTPNWSALIKRDPKSGVVHITRLDQQQPAFTYTQKQRQVYFKAQSYGFLINDQGWPPRWRIQFPAGKTERIPSKRARRP